VQFQEFCDLVKRFGDKAARKAKMVGRVCQIFTHDNATTSATRDWEGDNYGFAITGSAKTTVMPVIRGHSTYTTRNHLRITLRSTETIHR
jgi:hypothetical protein